MLKNISIRKKLMVSFTSLMVFIIILSFLSGIFLKRISDENDNLYNHPFIVTNAIKDCEINIRELYSTMSKVVNPVNQDNLDTLTTQITQLEADFEESVEVLEEHYLGDLEDVYALETAFNDSKDTRDAVISSVLNSDYPGALNIMSDTGEATKIEIFSATATITEFAENKADELRQSVLTHTRSYYILMITVSISLILFTAVGFYYLTLDIFPPIKQLLGTIDSYKKGENKTDLPLERKDEIGVISNALNEMFVNIKTEQELKDLSMKLENTKSQELLRITLMSIGEGVITTDLNSRINDINIVAQELVGLSREEAIGKHIDEALKLYSLTTKLRVESLIPKVIRLKEKLIVKEHIRLASHNDEDYIVNPSYSPIIDENSNVYGVVVVFRDITAARKSTEQIRYLSEHDTLTGLKNRYYLEKQLLRIQEKNIKEVGIIMGDVNGLKITNDAFGHAFGDGLLIDIAAILTEATKTSNATIVRYGGDEFVIVVENVKNYEMDDLCATITKLCSTNKSHNPVKPNISLGYSIRENAEDNIYKTLIKAEDMMYENKLIEKNSNRSKIVSSLENSLFEKNYETEEHALRVATYSKLISNQLNLSFNEKTQITLLSRLHDIGKISVDDSILSKRGKLNEDDWEIIKKHPETGYRIASNLNELVHIADGILTHHEYYDGSGYPRGIKGDDIPLMARIVSITDAFDVMTSSRAYKDAMSKEKAIEELKRCKGTQFDPVLVDIFVSEIKKTL